MPSINLFQLYIRGWRLVVILASLGFVLALVFSLIQTKKYSSQIRLLITQTNVTGVDPYTAIKSTERIGQNLSELVFSSTFFNGVINQGGVDANYFTLNDEIDKRKEWAETISVGVTPGTGVMYVTAYHPDRAQAAAIAIAVADQLAEQAPNFFGYSVRVQIIDDPLPSRFYAKPDFVSNLGFGLIFGFLVGSAWVLARVRQIR
jgi:capsular polysaccharide biosynthesis protein